MGNKLTIHTHTLTPPLPIIGCDSHQLIPHTTIASVYADPDDLRPPCNSASFHRGSSGSGSGAGGGGAVGGASAAIGGGAGAEVRPVAIFTRLKAKTEAGTEAEATEI